MTRELARQKDIPRDIIIRLTGSQKSQSEYHLDEITRLKEKIEELVREFFMGLEEQKRRYNMEIEELTHQYDAKIENLIHQYEAKIEERDRRLAQTESLEIFRDLLSLDCPRELSRKTTILECASRRARHGCIKKNCSAREKLISYLYYFFKK